MNRIWINSKLVVLLTLILSCSDDDGSSSSSTGIVTNDANEAIIDNITVEVIVAGYSELNTKVAELVTTLDALKGSASQANLEAAQIAWKAARVPWESGESHIFGPVDTLGVDPASDSWPLINSD